jgi:uncharacterized DUF497 family protein
LTSPIFVTTLITDITYNQIVVVGFVQRGEVRHVFSMRKANARETIRLAPILEFGPEES